MVAQQAPRPSRGRRPQASVPDTGRVRSKAAPFEPQREQTGACADEHQIVQDLRDTFVRELWAAEREHPERNQEPSRTSTLAHERLGEQAEASNPAAIAEPGLGARRGSWPSA